MKQVILLLGTNLGDKFNNIDKAILLISERIGKITAKSSIYESEAWGFLHESSFINQVVICNTEHHAEEVLEIILNIENIIGRDRVTGSSQEYSARIIDIDILFYENICIKAEKLIIPHPRLHLRKFTLLPLVEIVPNLIHPIFNKSIQSLLCMCNDKLYVRKC